ncbi:sigma-54 dependent transcriptional regulator [Sphingomonas sp.]|uniref:sigma-54-dependent transcriptional regulator n=1 Tax=Sphingomonas sp. TaxID=28214 RepID=UPI001EB51019|nr:sigma-54 dependent transcriptional regulator [Sphingomonas sp.]MBX3594882.1 sigma-54-dependent Fis family transcriptional regulator [Sphingomonas sp.]
MTRAPAPAVLFIEDDAALREAMVQSLALENVKVDAHARAAPALESLSPDFPGVVVTDIRLPGMDGLELFAAIRDLDPDLPVILTTGHGDIAMAVAAMKQGAADFLTKPYSSAALVDAIRRAADRRALVIENRKLHARLRDREAPGLIGSSDRIRRLEGLVGEVARTGLDIVLTGPAGVGKTFLANRIHQLSPRHGRPLVAIDAGIWTHPDVELIVFGRAPSDRASRSGLIERAQGGTLVLDNIESVPEPLRGRLGSLLETRTFRALGADRPRTADIRVIAATSGETDVATSGLLRHLGGISIALPSLDERREDIPEIFRHFVAELEAELEIPARPMGAQDLSRLLASDWPGNLRQLRDFARHYVHGLTDYTDGPAARTGDDSLTAVVAAFERSILLDALTRYEGRVSRIERALKVKRKTLYDKLARHGLTPGDFRGPAPSR